MDSYVDSSAAVSGGVLGVIFAMIGIFLLIILIVSIFQIIGQWKMFKKAGEPGWAAIVPIYNTYILCKITGVSPWWILITFCCSLVGGFIPVVGPLLSAAGSIYFAIMLAGSTAKSFGKDTGWAVGLFFLPPFFSFALGVGSSEYVGPVPMNDPIMGAVNKNNNQANPATPADQPAQEAPVASQSTPPADAATNPQVKFCPNCGNKL